MKNIFVVLGIILILILVAISVRSTKDAAIEQDPEVLVDLAQDDRDYFAELNNGIRSGGPPKDGIPAVDNPQYESATEADEWLLSHDVVFGVDYRGETIAFPQRILVWHEIANETLGGEHISVTYCPLTGTAIGFKNPTQNSSNPTLGVSGKLVNSNLIMYDRESDSYWPQIAGTAITGPHTGDQLEEFPVTWTTWERWKTVHPDTRVLSRDTGFFRNYTVSGDPYGSYVDEGGYYTDTSIIFPPNHEDTRLHPKEVVVGIRDSERNATAVTKKTLRERKVMDVELGDRTVTLTYLPDLDFYEARYSDTDEWINAFDAMWFAWAGYYPETSLIQ